MTYVNYTLPVIILNVHGLNTLSIPLAKWFLKKIWSNYMPSIKHTLNISEKIENYPSWKLLKQQNRDRVAILILTKKDFKILRKKIVTRDKEHFITMKESICQ